jgi:PAS domain S-box-containing protein
MMSTSAALPGTYDYGEVARSVLIAIAASYAALDLGGRVTAASGRVRLAWLSAGAIAMGIGIWEMHLKGMLAFHLTVPVEYHWPTGLAALVVAIFASAVALYVTSRQKMGRVEALTGSMVMGSGIAGLHYLLMAAMRLPAVTLYSPLWVTCSISLAILFSLIALLMASGLREETRWSIWRRVGSAAVMGIAISAMHYTGMAAATFFPSSPPDLTHAVSITAIGGSAVVITTLIVLAAAVITSSVDRRASAEIQRLNQDLEHRVAERTLQLETVNQSLRKEILERERIETTLRKQKEIFQKVFENIPVMIAFAGPDRHLELMNPELERATGWGLEEIRARNVAIFSELFPDPHDRQVVRDAITASDRKWIDLKVKVRSGDEIDVAAALVHLSDGSIVGIAKDVTELKRTESELQEAKDKLALVTRMQAMGELVAAIAHEVNQPLTAIITNGSFCLRSLEGAAPDPDQLQAAITEIVNDGTRASAVISRIRGVLTRWVPQRTELDINQVVHEVTNLVSHELSRHRVSWSTDLAAGLPRVRGDAVQLQQVLINLILNAVEAMKVSAEGPRDILIRSARNADGVLVKVQDSGPGIEPGLPNRIFEPFFTTKPEGTGMGLSISRSIVQSHGGELTLIPSSLGAMFQFTIPGAGTSHD